MTKMVLPSLKTLYRALFLLPLLINHEVIKAEEFNIPIDEQREITIEVQRAKSAQHPANTLLIWLEELDEERPLFEQLLRGLNEQGMDLWRVNLFASYFIERTRNNRNNLDGKGVAALIQYAVENTDQRIALVAAEHMSLVALRGVREWQKQGLANERFSGVILHYPNLFDTAPMAGDEPKILPLARSVNVPIYIFQPEYGPQKHRTKTYMQALWEGGSPAMLYWVKGVRDWWFMHEEQTRTPQDVANIKTMPKQMRDAVAWMDKIPMPKQAPELHANGRSERIRGLVATHKVQLAKDFILQAARGGTRRLSDKQGSVVLVNFWATWCPPCVEEVPSMNRLASHYKDRDFSIVSINFMEESKAISSFMQQLDVDFPVLLDPQGVTADQWNVFAFPTSFLIDRQGRIRYSVNSAIDWNTQNVTEVIDELVQEKTR